MMRQISGTPITVGDLVTKLQELDQELPVFAYSRFAELSVPVGQILVVEDEESIDIRAFSLHPGDQLVLL